MFPYINYKICSIIWLNMSMIVNVNDSKFFYGDFYRNRIIYFSGNFNRFKYIFKINILNIFLGKYLSCITNTFVKQYQIQNKR